MKLNNKFNIGDTVYLATDPDQSKRMITGIIIRGNMGLTYYVAFREDESTHYEIELSHDKDIVLATSN